MTMTDPVADLLTTIRNANMAFKDEVTIPASTLKARIAEILTKEGYVAGISVEGEGKERVKSGSRGLWSRRKLLDRLAHIIK